MTRIQSDVVARERADTLIVDCDWGPTAVRVDIQIDGVHYPSCLVSFQEPDMRLDGHYVSVLACMIAAVASQMCLARRVVLKFRTQPSDVDMLRRLMTMLYDVHCYTQGLPRTGFALVTPRLAWFAEQAGADDNADRRRAALLWSGGKDSYASLETLRRNDFYVRGIHVTASFDADDCETNAARTLAKDVGLDLCEVEMDWRTVYEIGRRYSRQFARPPLVNSIPHGRDMVLVAAAAQIGYAQNASYICAGYEFDLWEKTIQKPGFKIHRHDTQSRYGATLMNRLFRSSFGIGFFSPIASITEYRLLKSLLPRRHLWSRLQSCFWGKWCGACPKCIRYCLVQRQLGCQSIDFGREPLDNSNAGYKQAWLAVSDPTMPFWQETTFCLYDLLCRGEIPVPRGTEVDEVWFRANRGRLLHYLTVQRSNDLAPDGFHVDT